MKEIPLPKEIEEVRNRCVKITEWITILFWAIVLGLITLVLCSAKIVAAPAPVAKVNVVKPKTFHSSMVGDWTMEWAGSNWNVGLTKDGNYTAKQGDCTYVGSWTVDESRKLIVITEALAPACNNWVTFATPINGPAEPGHGLSYSGVLIKFIRK